MGKAFLEEHEIASRRREYHGDEMFLPNPFIFTYVSGFGFLNNNWSMGERVLFVSIATNLEQLTSVLSLNTIFPYVFSEVIHNDIS